MSRPINTMKHVVVLCGGRSAEHEVSFLSARSILSRLNQAKYRISVVGIQKDGLLYSPEATRDKLGLESCQQFHFPSGKHWVCLLLDLDPVPDVVFPALHGPFGEDGTIQGTLEVLNIPYVGAGVRGSVVGLNKIHSKKILLDSGMPVLPYLSLAQAEWQEGAEDFLKLLEKQLHYPVFVKPANLGSSVGINRSKDRDELSEHIGVAFRYDDFIVIEEGIEAREIETSVLGNSQPEVSRAGEIIPSREFYSYEAKYHDKDTQLLIPAPLSEKQMQRVQELALATFRALQLEGMARVDFLMDKNTGQFWVSEANTIPGFTDISMYPRLWEASGLPYPELLDKLIDLGLERHRRRSRFSVER
ncbi:MAG: D-alanine--D-alanine ligase [Acidobacteria bacterium]|nr:D-alanine--D-alanine ligase [Acidobacteriota bacterium]